VLAHSFAQMRTSLLNQRTQAFLDSLVSNNVVTRTRTSPKLFHSYADIRRTAYKSIPMDRSNPSIRGEHKDALTSRA